MGTGFCLVRAFTHSNKEVENQMVKWFSHYYDIMMSPLEQRGMREIRELLLSKATGKVLEIGSGTGLNFPHYKNAEEIIAIEPDSYMRSKSMTRLKESNIPIRVIDCGAERMPFPDNSFDTAVGTLVFCTIPNPKMALQEIKRVCKPDAKILLFEHVRLDHPLIGRIQDWVTPLWKHLCDGCHLNRNTIDVLKQEGFRVTRMNTHYKRLFVTIEAINKKGI